MRDFLLTMTIRDQARLWWRSEPVGFKGSNTRCREMGGRLFSNATITKPRHINIWPLQGAAGFVSCPPRLSCLQAGVARFQSMASIEDKRQWEKRRRARKIAPARAPGWINVFDVGPTWSRRWANVSHHLRICQLILPPTNQNNASPLINAFGP